MSLGVSIYSVLSGESTITDLVSTRIFPVVAPASANFPLIVYEKLSHDVGYSHDSGDDGIYSAVYRFNVIAETYADAVEIQDTLRTFLSGKEGTFGTNDVSLIRLIGESDGYDHTTLLYNLTSDFQVDINS